MLVDLKREMIHDATMPRYREPVGAVKTGQSVTIRFRTRCSDIQSVYLRLFNEGYESMCMMNQTDDIWDVTVTAPDRPNVYWYYFCINIAGKIIYYGVDGSRGNGAGNVYSDPPPAFQLTVYDADFDTPDWFKKSIMYQIFPDRFKRSDMEQAKQGLDYHRSKGRDVYFHEDWNEMPLYNSPEATDRITQTTFSEGR